MRDLEGRAEAGGWGEGGGGQLGVYWSRLIWRRKVFTKESAKTMS